MIVKLENMEKYMFKGVGEYEIPQVKPVPVEKYKQVKWFPYSRMAIAAKKKNDFGIHFFIYDHLFTCLWQDPDKYISILREYPIVTGPDYSIYTNMSKSIQIYNSFRKHWIEAYFQMYGVNMIPVISWALPQSYSWCFDGDPKHSVVAISTLGVFRDHEKWDLFMMGFEEMKKRLEPTMILCNGRIPDEIAGEVVPMEKAYTYKH